MYSKSEYLEYITFHYGMLCNGCISGGEGGYLAENSDFSCADRPCSGNVEWLTDNDTAYRAHEARGRVRMAGTTRCTAAARHLQSHGIANVREDDKRDDSSLMLKPDGQVAVMNLRWR